MKHLESLGAKPLPGYQLRYIYFLHPEEIKNLTCPIIPFSEIEKAGAGMYKGKQKTCAGSKDDVAGSFQEPGGGSIPTPALH